MSLNRKDDHFLYVLHAYFSIKVAKAQIIIAEGDSQPILVVWVRVVYPIA